MADEPKWDLKSEENGVSLFQRTLDDSSLQEIRGQIKINAPLATVISIISDSEHWTQWMPRTKQAKILQKDPSGVVFYTRFKGFGPIWDREVYLAMTPRCAPIPESRYKTHRVEVRFTTEDKRLKKYFSSSKNVIRIPIMIGHWSIWQAELATKTYVEYQAFVDAGGQLIDGIKNIAARTLVKRALINLQKQVSKYPEPDYERLQKEAPSLFPKCVTLPIP